MSLYHTINASEITLAYLAGIADGEGSFMIKKQIHRQVQKMCYHERFSVKMLDIEPLMLFKQIFRSSIRNWTYIRKSDGKHQVLHHYDCSDKIARTLCYNLLPFLRVKRQQAELIIKLGENKIFGDGRFRKRLKGIPAKDIKYREQLYQKVKELNHS